MNAISKIKEVKVFTPKNAMVFGIPPKQLIADLPGERWKPMKREDLDQYYISSKGRVKTTKNPRKEMLMKQTESINKALRVCMTTKDKKRATFTVHNLVVGLFLLDGIAIDDDDKNCTMVVEHEDKNKSNNDVTNLRWIPKGEQAQIRNRDRAANKDRNIKRPITQFDLEGNHKRDWANAKEACDMLPPLRHEELIKCIGNGRKPGGCFWEFTNDDDIIEEENEDILPGEIWLPITEEGYSHYHISSEGRFKNSNTRHVYRISNPKEDDGYKGVVLKGKTDENGKLDRTAKNVRRLIHRLVANRHVPNDDPVNKTTVDHIDRNKLNNKATNLRWASTAEQNRNRETPKTNTNGKQIIQFDKNGNFIERFNSMNEAKQKLQLSKDKLGDACKNGTEYNGYVWKYAVDVEDPINYPDEEWRLIPHPELLPMEASNYGRIKNHKGDIVSGSIAHDYLAVNVYRREDIGVMDENGQQKHESKYIHRLVIDAFKGRRDELTPNHLDGNKTNNTPDNLDYTTQSENSFHAYATGLRKDKPKAIVCIKPDGVEFGRYVSYAEADRKIKESGKLTISSTSIRRHCKSGKLYEGYKFINETKPTK